MSYTKPEQAICSARDKALMAFRELNHVITERLADPNEWKAEHLDALAKLQADLAKVIRQISNL